MSTILCYLLFCSPFEHYFVKFVTSTSLRLKLLCNVTWPAMFSMLSLYNSWRLVRRQETEFRRGLRFTVARAGKVERCRNTTNISLYFISGEPSCEKMQHPKLSLNDQFVSPWSNINLHLKKMSNLRSGSKVISSRYQSTLTGLLLMWKLLYEFQISWDETLAFNSIRSLTISTLRTSQISEFCFDSHILVRLKIVTLIFFLIFRKQWN